MRTEEINKWINEGGTLPQDLTPEEKEHLKGLGWMTGHGWHDNGQKCYESHALHGAGAAAPQNMGWKHGKQAWWYPNGQKRYEDNFLHGKQHGKQEGWHDNGQKEYEYNYLHGMKHGVFKQWDKDGNLIRDKEYLYGNKIK